MDNEMRKYDLVLIIGFLLCIVGVMYFGIVHGFNITNITEMRDACMLMKYSDEWTLGYLRELAGYCSNT